MKPIYKNLVVTSFFVSLATTAFPIFLPSYFNEIGLSNFEVGISLALLYFTTAILSLGIGFFEEKIDKIKILISSYFGYVLLPIFYLSIGGLISILLVRIYDGIVSALRYVSKYSILETETAHQTRVNVSLTEAASDLASFLGPILAGIVALNYGMNMIFVIASIILFVVAIYSIRFLKFSNHKFVTRRKISFSFKKLLRNRSLIILSIVFFLFSVVNVSKFMAITLYMKSLNFNNFTIGLIGGSFFFFTFLFQLFSGFWKMGQLRNKFLALGLLLCSLSMFLFSMDLVNLYYFLFLALLFSVGIALVRPITFANLAVIGDKKSYADTALLFFFFNMGAVIGLISAGLLTPISFNLFFIFGGIVLLISSGISLKIDYLKKFEKRN